MLMTMRLLAAMVRPGGDEGKQLTVVKLNRLNESYYAVEI